MSEDKESSIFIRKVDEQSRRKLRSQKNPETVWFGLGMMGLIGWSVIVPTMLGAIFGSWLDKVRVTGHSWTLALIVAGLCLGCLNAWLWMGRQHQRIKKQQESDDD